MLLTDLSSQVCQVCIFERGQRASERASERSKERERSEGWRSGERDRQTDKDEVERYIMASQPSGESEGGEDTT
jgi:hypothetical protein